MNILKSITFRAVTTDRIKYTLIHGNMIDGVFGCNIYNGMSMYGVDCDTVGISIPGLIDKNGRQAYTDDVIRMTGDVDGVTVTDEYVIIFDRKIYGFIFRKLDPTALPETIDGTDSADIEIIGNIFTLPQWRAVARNG